MCLRGGVGRILRGDGWQIWGFSFSSYAAGLVRLALAPGIVSRDAEEAAGC